jgi:hypothetical protein
VSFAYRTGETIQKDDRIRYAGGRGIVDFVADGDISNPEAQYFIEEFGGGCMILTERFGRVFVERPEDDEDLEFVSRGGGPAAPRTT